MMWWWCFHFSLVQRWQNLVKNTNWSWGGVFGLFCWQYDFSDVGVPGFGRVVNIYKLFDHIWILYSICMYLHEYTCKYWCVQKLGDISPLVECCWFFYICCHVEANKCKEEILRSQSYQWELPGISFKIQHHPLRRLAHWRRASEAHASWQISVGIDVAWMVNLSFPKNHFFFSTSPYFLWGVGEVLLGVG